MCVCVRERERKKEREIFGQIVAYCTNLTKFQIAYTTNGGDLLLERESRRQTPRLQTVLASLMSEPPRFMDCGTVTVENRLSSSRNHFRFIIV